MLTSLKNLSIKLKISGFVIPSTIAFGILMTILSLYFLNDYKTTSQDNFRQVILQVQQEQSQGASHQNVEKLLGELSVQADEHIGTIRTIFISIVVVVIILATIGAIFISTLIGKPVQRAAEGLENISSGDADLTQRLPVSADDETGKLSRFFNIFLEKLQGIIKNLQSSGEKLSGAAQTIHSLIATIQEKTSSAKETSQTVFRSAGYMSKDMKEISSVIEESTGSVHVISSAVEELSSTVSEIAETSGRAHQNTEDAKSRMDLLEKEVQELGAAGEDISKVTETIAEISEQVNLLALNATIEAARAGEAGKGFAVVANEIKDLAHQTSSAATEIQQRIDQVQRVTKSTINGIVEATATVADNTDIVSTIATAVEEQSATVNEIAQSLANASERLDYSNEKVSKASEYAEDIASMANSVTDTVDQVDKAVEEIRTTSETLNNLADEQAQSSAQFRTS
ncbi:MAG: methyl-accepting chemotaxis protein [Desulfocapsaceae bacterium]|nr:methyl-accepting chemotaxis protein [Desulfocapsaceae bacterium]